MLGMRKDLDALQQKKEPLFDHLIGAAGQGVRHVDAQRLYSVGGMSSTPLGVETARLFDTEPRVQGVGAPHAVKDYFSANTWIVPPCGTSRY